MSDIAIAQQAPFIKTWDPLFPPSSPTALLWISLQSWCVNRLYSAWTYADFWLMVKVISSAVPVILPIAVLFLFEPWMQNDPWSGEHLNPALVWIKICELFTLWAAWGRTLWIWFRRGGIFKSCWTNVSNIEYFNGVSLPVADSVFSNLPSRSARII